MRSLLGALAGLKEERLVFRSSVPRRGVSWHGRQSKRVGTEQNGRKKAEMMSPLPLLISEVAYPFPRSNRHTQNPSNPGPSAASSASRLIGTDWGGEERAKGSIFRSRVL